MSLYSIALLHLRGIHGRTQQNITKTYKNMLRSRCQWLKKIFGVLSERGGDGHGHRATSAAQKGVQKWWGQIQIPNIHLKKTDMYNYSSFILSEKRFGLVLRALLLSLANAWPFASWWSLCGSSCKQIWIRASIPSQDQQNHPWLGLQNYHSLSKTVLGRILYLSKWNPFSGCVVLGNQNLASTDYSQFQMETNVEPQDDLWYPSLCRKTWLQPSLS